MVRPAGPRGKLIDTHVMLSPDQLARLKAASKKTGATVSELIRLAIDDFLKRQK